MELPLERVGPYVRALRAGLDALAPNEDHVPLAACQAHLHALDPVLSGNLLLPAEVALHSGMPAFTWMERALSEQAIARGRSEQDDPSEHDLRRAASLDAELGRRMRDRKALHQHLREAELLPVTRLGAAVRRLGRSTDFSVRYDRMAPDGRWLRIRVDLRVPAPRRRAGPLAVTEDGHIDLDDRLQHLITRHFATPLLALRAQLADATESQILRLSRAWVGPFWFPGIPLPAGVPAALGSGLLLHLSQEIVGEDVPVGRHLDPWLAPPHEAPPKGQGIFRERRFAGSPGVLAEVRAWMERQGMRTVTVPLGGGPVRRQL